MFKHVNFGKHIWIHTSKIKIKNILILKFHPGMKRLHISFLFFILGWNFIPVFFTGMSSSRDEISSREKGVNSKRHFTIDRDDLIPGRVSSRTSHWVWKHIIKFVMLAWYVKTLDDYFFRKVILLIIFVCLFFY